MIDYADEIMTSLKHHLSLAYPTVSVVGEYQSVPATFPTLTIDEISNIPIHLDKAPLNKYASIRYRIQIFSNSENGKRKQAREIYKITDEYLQSIGLICRSYSTTPNMYYSQMYQITANYEGVINRDGVIYRN